MRYIREPEPKGCFTYFLELLVATVASIALLKYTLLFIIRNWWVILILVIIAGTIVVYRLLKRRKDQGY